MGFECTALPSKVALDVWELGDVSAKLTKWKRKLKDTFGIRGLVTVMKLGEADPRNIPLPDTPKKAKSNTQVQTPAIKKEVFGTSAASPYFMDSHIVTPKKSRASRRYTDDDDDDDDNDDIGGGDDPCDDLAAQIRRTYLREDEEEAQQITLTNHISLMQLTKFSGACDRSERSLQLLKKFIYEMEGTNTPQDRWCEAFQLCMEDGAGYWVRQLPKKTRKRWSLLCEAFMTYYCSQYDQTPASKYYTAERDSGEHICDYLLRLNGYARSASIYYKFGGRTGEQHVKHFLETI
ncbi:unnamed protein product [Phytophthora lilii]|uniref:Unnamed protein product n=1 Tax=Phytophthora lilii TaxID=2077276 RepID=A0A9W6XMX4_9STRA|nr:unnamed protein product [Phytophthora lilii]